MCALKIMNRYIYIFSDGDNYKTITNNSVQDNNHIPHTELLPDFICNKAILQVIKQTIEEI